MMEKSKLKRANELIQCINFLQNFIGDTRPDFCNGVGFVDYKGMNCNKYEYRYELHNTVRRDNYMIDNHPYNIIECDLMYAAIEAAHSKAKELLDQVNEELEEL